MYQRPYRIIESFGVEGTFKGSLVQALCHGQEHLSPGSEVQVDDMITKILQLLVDHY